MAVQILNLVNIKKCQTRVWKLQTSVFDARSKITPFALSVTPRSWTRRDNMSMLPLASLGYARKETVEASLSLALCPDTFKGGPAEPRWLPIWRPV